MGKYARDNDVVFSVHTNNSIVGQARDLCVKAALEADASHIFFFDDDMIFAPDTAIRLLKADKDWVGALAFTARDPIAPVLYRFVDEWNGEKRQVDRDIQPIFDYQKDTLQRVDAMGTGVVLIKADVFRKLPEPWFNAAHGSGEDIHLCSEMSKYGLEVWCDTSVKTKHVPVYTHWMDEERYEAVYRDTDLQQLVATGKHPVHTD